LKWVKKKATAEAGYYKDQILDVKLLGLPASLSVTPAKNRYRIE
jgi:hypothetical protein